MHDERAVLAANKAFYDAFAARDVATMDALWARRAPVTCVHPGWQALRGRDAVLASWRGILLGPSPPDIECADATAHLLGDTAFVICTERLPGAELVATNVFVREDGAWRLVQHHASGVVRPVVEAEADDEDSGGLLH